MLTRGCAWFAMRRSADIGSPWLPVVRMTSSSSGTESISLSPMITPSGADRYPRLRATLTLRTIERPTTATMRPSRYAASITCCMRSICDEKVVTITRPGEVANRLASAGPTASSARLPDTGTSALVESPSITSTPRSPRRARPGMSLRFDGPPMGRWSNLKSPVCSRVPAGE